MKKIIDELKEIVRNTVELLEYPVTLEWFVNHSVRHLKHHLNLIMI